MGRFQYTVQVYWQTAFKEAVDMRERRRIERRNLAAESAPVGRVRMGKIFNADQRRIPDRRLNNISVEYISIDDFYLKSSNSAYHS